MFTSYEQYREAWKNAFTETPPVPLNVDIELASLCNLACPFCFWGEASFNAEMLKHADDGRPKKRLMPAEIAFSIIKQAHALGVPALKFNWRGESTIHPQYSQIISYARSLGFYDLLVNTNANCKPHAIDGLMRATKCMISLDSCVPETYAKMRVNGNLERAIEVGKELIKRGHSNLWFRRVIAKENAHEKFKEDVDKIFGGVGYKVSEHHCVDRNTDSTHQTNNPDNYERTYCGYPSQRLMVAADGSCYPCCVDYDGTMPMGDINKQSIKEIWDSINFSSLRFELKNNVFKSDICKKCTSWMSYKSPQRENVQDKAL